MVRRWTTSAMIAVVVAVGLGLAVVTHVHPSPAAATSSLCFICQNGVATAPAIATSPLPSGIIEELVSEPATLETIAVDVEHPGHEPPAGAC